MKVLAVAILTLGLLGAGRAGAETLFYTENATASGSLGGVSFNNDSIQLIITADSGGIIDTDGVLTDATSFVLLEIQGVGDAVITEPTQIFAAGDEVGLRTTPQGSVSHDILDISSPLLAGYNLLDPEGPQLPGTPLFTGNDIFTTTDGDFMITQADMDGAFFSAGGGDSSDPVPEPTTTALFLGGLALLIGTRLRKPRLAQVAA
ncbi:MAG: PEP-CTERM sorting domain-containing protein [Verrucomicrobiota bacterium]